MLYPPQETVDIAFSPRDPEKIYALERWGRILASSDGGKVWSGISLPFDAQVEGIELKKISAGAGGKLLVLTSHGWLTSEDGGKIWNESRFGKRARPLYRLILSIHNGYFFGPSFVWAYDLAALALFILIVSGLILWNIGRKTG